MNHTGRHAVIFLVSGFVILFSPLMNAEQASPTQLYEQACASCHGVDGKGRSLREVAFSTPLPDFSDCEFASREPDADWFAVVHEGGPVRAFDRLMPAFGEALSDQEIDSVLTHVRTFCDNKDWPRGEFNLPRPLFTEKAYPEDEAVATMDINLGDEGAVVTELLYEKRFGSRSMIEVAVPVGWRESAVDGDWEPGVGNIALGLKHTLFHDLGRGTIISVGGEVLLPAVDHDKGFGRDTTIIEPFVTWGQLLPQDYFFQAHAFAELPTDSAFDDEAGLRLAFGRSFSDGRFGRSWSPMLETLLSRDLVGGAETNIDLVPQVQVSLNTRQHILFNIGVRTPVNNRESRDAQLVFYVLWDWFDGGLFDGW